MTNHHEEERSISAHAAHASIVSASSTLNVMNTLRALHPQRNERVEQLQHSPEEEIEEPMSTISKTTFTYTVLHRTDEPVMSIEEAMSRAWDGDAVGGETEVIAVHVPDEQVEDELVALGNDGEFFNDALGLGDSWDQ